MTSRKSVWLAFAGSFAVYFIPLVGPHAIPLVFEGLWQQFRDLKYPGWAFGDLAVTLGLQAVTFAVGLWFWRRPRVLSFAAFALWGLTAIVLAEYAFLLWLPSRFLIEAESSPETGNWAEACRVSDASMMSWRVPRRLPHDGWSEVWISDSHNRQSVLRMPDCERTAAPLPEPQVQPGGHVDYMIGITQVVPGGLALVQRQETSTGKLTWLLLDTRVGTLSPLPSPPTDKYVAPYLSDDGSQTAWILDVPGSGPPVLDVLHLLPVNGGGDEARLDLAPFGPASYETVGVNDRTGEILLWMGVEGRLLATSLDGRERPAPAIPAGVRPQSHTIVLTEHGVLAWDAYKDDDNYTLAWSMDTGSGSRRVPRGSSITAAAADPTGRYVAVSTSTTLNIGDVRDTVFVLHTSDGREVFRRFLPKYSRTNVAFIGRDYFAYSDISSTHVLRISE
jgi:hypothetical protein